MQTQDKRWHTSIPWGLEPTIPVFEQVIALCSLTSRDRCDRRLNYLTYIHLLMELSPSWEASNCAATQDVPKIYVTRRFITVFTRALHWSISWARSIQSIPAHPISVRPILILSLQLPLGLPSDLVPSGFPTNILYAFLFSLVRVTCPAYLIHFYLIFLIILGEEYRIWSSSLCSFLQPPDLLK
jgi:hypothetical protein